MQSSPGEEPEAARAAEPNCHMDTCRQIGMMLFFHLSLNGSCLNCLKAERVPATQQGDLSYYTGSGGKQGVCLCSWIAISSDQKS